MFPEYVQNLAVLFLYLMGFVICCMIFDSIRTSARELSKIRDLMSRMVKAMEDVPASVRAQKVAEDVAEIRKHIAGL